MIKKTFRFRKLNKSRKHMSNPLNKLQTKVFFKNIFFRFRGLKVNQRCRNGLKSSEQSTKLHIKSMQNGSMINNREIASRL